MFYTKYIHVGLKGTYVRKKYGVLKNKVKHTLEE